MSVHVSENNGSARWSRSRSGISNAIVAELRAVARASRQDDTAIGRHARCPRARRCATILDGLFGALFPTHFGLPDLTDEGIDYFVGHTLDATLRSLHEQVQRELQFASQPAMTVRRCDAIDGVSRSPANSPRVCRAFARCSKATFSAAYQGDPAAKSIEEVRFCYPGITAITHHRLAHELYLLGRAAAGPHHRGDRALGDRHRHPSGRGNRRELFHRSRHRRGHRRDGDHRRARAPLPGGHAGRQELSGRRRRRAGQGHPAPSDRRRRRRDLCRARRSWAASRSAAARPSAATSGSRAACRRAATSPRRRRAAKPSTKAAGSSGEEVGPIANGQLETS